MFILNFIHIKSLIILDKFFDEIAEVISKNTKVCNYT
jgi:hypothetical protein